MPKAVLLTWGSHGDVVPFVALARALMQAGHAVALGAPPEHGDFVRQHGIEFHPLGSETAQDEYRRMMDRIVAEANPRKQMRMLLREKLLPDLEPQYRDSLAAVENADVVIAHWMQLAGIMAAETLGKPCATVTLNPVGVACVAEPAAAAEQHNLGKLLSDYLWGDAIHEFRRQHELPPIESVSDYQYSTELNLVAVSRFLFPEQDVFAPQHRITGFWPLRDERPWSPSPALQAFMSAPERPVVVTFGSMDGRAEEMTAIVVDAIRQLGCRAILQGGWAGLGRDLAHSDDAALSDNILVVDYVPHEYLFPRAACVVHHGGAGTTAAALRAGVPSVVVWYMLDQPYWGNVLASLSLGPKPLQRLGVTSAALAQRIGEAIAEPVWRSRCSAVAAQMAGEGAQTQAVAAIEAFIAARRGDA